MLKKINFIIVALFCIAAPVLAQQAQMHVHTPDGTVSYNTEDITSISFVELEDIIDSTFVLGISGQTIEMIWIPAGTFWMGAQDDETDAWDNELPRHQVTLTQGFWIGKYEVTQSQWEAVAGFENFQWPGNPDRPAENVSHTDIMNNFLPLINITEVGDPWRLPTEAEWEYACRAGYDSTWFYWGNDYDVVGNYAWLENNSGNTTHNVGEKLPNPWGLYDMLGNVWELCSDYLSDDYYANSPSIDPPGPETGTFFSDRGGSWDRTPDRCRPACRGGGIPSFRGSFVGFRLVRDE